MCQLRFIQVCISQKCFKLCISTHCRLITSPAQMQCCFNVATRTNQMDRRCLLTSGFIRVQCTGTNCSSLTTPINISMFSGLWKWEKICTGFICFSNFSIIATRLSKLFPLQNLLYSPTQGKRKVKNKRFSVRLKKIIKNPWSINLTQPAPVKLCIAHEWSVWQGAASWLLW